MQLPPAKMKWLHKPGKLKHVAGYAKKSEFGNKGGFTNIGDSKINQKIM